MDQIERVIDLFDKSGKDKILFEPAIRIKMTPHSQITWIDKMYRNRDNYMVTISTLNDSMNLSINAIDPVYLSSILIRLYTLYGKENVSN